jgi:lipopolysaccharide heptosyltransferase II
MTAMDGSPWRHARRIVAIRLDNLGDVLMTTPALAAIRHTVPDAHLTLLTSPGAGALAPHLPFVDSTLAVRAPWVKQPDGARTADLAQIAADLERRRFDAAIVFTTYTQSALPAAMLAMLARIPLRLAYSRENPYALLTHWVPEPEPALRRHEVERQLALVARIGCTTPDPRLRFALARPDVDAVSRRLARAGLDPHRPYLVVHPGASAPSRRYPADRFGSALRLIGQRRPLPVVFTGSVDERALVAEAREQAGDAMATVDLAGALSLGELGALIARSALLICNNSGPAHLAAALGTPVVDLYALTNPQHMPWRTAARVLYHDVPCRDCLRSVCPEGHHACLRGVAPAQVAQAALDLLASATEPAVVPFHRTPALNAA